MRDSFLVSLAVGLSVFSVIALVMLLATIQPSQFWVVTLAACMGFLAFTASFLIELRTTSRE